MTWRPSVTVGIPVYNTERYIGVAIESFLAQTRGDFELVISDNASTDGTGDICREYAARDSRIRYSRSPINIGVARNYTRVLEMCSTDYFKWASADDMVAPRFLERCVKVLEEHPEVVLAYARARLIDGEGATIRDYEDGMHLYQENPARRFLHVHEHLRLANPIQGVNRTATLRKTLLMGSYLGSDIVFLFELALHGQFYEVPEVLFLRRFHQTAYSNMSDPIARVAYYNPRGSLGFASYYWRRLFELGRVIERSPIPAQDRRVLRSWLLKQAIWGRRDLAAEAWAAAKWLTTRSVRPATRTYPSRGPA